jgi:hypothetical protein
MSDEFDKFEEQFEGVEDPNPFRVQASESHAREVWEAMVPVCDWTCDDLIKALTTSGMGICQYLNQQTGASITCMMGADARTLLFKVELPADGLPFIKVLTPEELAANDYPYEPEVYDPDKDDGF